MVKAKKQEVDPIAGEVATPVESKVSKKAKKTSLSVYDGDRLVRTYSVEVHGENFEEVMKEFLDQHPDYTVV